ncbi:MAG: hypothetical protein JSR17_01055 [Proteobacteria bacterium]|nr:hypothetical protein [Pseudomonadota bacterium]
MEQFESKREQASKKIYKKYVSKANLYKKMNDIELNFMNMRGRVQKYFMEYPSEKGGELMMVKKIYSDVDEPEKKMYKTKNILFKLNNGIPLGDDDKKHIKSIQSNKTKIINELSAYTISEQKAADAYKYFQQFQNVKQLESEAMYQIIKTGVMYLTVGVAVGSFVILTGYITLPSSAALISQGASSTLFGYSIPTSIATFLKTNQVMLSFKIMTVVQAAFTKDITEVFKTMASESVSLGLIFVSSNYHILDLFSKETIESGGVLGKVLVNFKPNTFLSRYTAGVGKMLVGKISNYMIVPKPDPKDLQAELLEQQLKFKKEMNRIKNLLENGEIDVEKLTPEIVQEGWISKTTKDMLYKNRHTIYFWTIASGIAGAWISLALPAIKESYPWLGDIGETGTAIVGDYAIQYVLDTYVSQKILGYLMGKLTVWVRKSVEYTLKKLKRDPNTPLFAQLDKYLQQKYGIEILHRVTVLNIFSELLLVAGQMEVQSISYKIPTVMTQTIIGGYKNREVFTWENLTSKNIKTLFQFSWDNALQITSGTNIGGLLEAIDKKFASLYPSPSSASPSSQPIGLNIFPPSLYFQHGQPISLPVQEPFPSHTEESKTYRIQQAMLAGNTNSREQIDAIINIEKAITNLESEHTKLKSFISDNNSFLGDSAVEYQNRADTLNENILNLRNMRQVLVDLFSQPPRRISSAFHHQMFVQNANKIGDKIAETNDYLKKTSDDLTNDTQNISKINALKDLTNKINNNQINDIKKSVDGFNTFGPNLQNVQDINDQYKNIEDFLREINADINSLNNLVLEKKQNEFNEAYQKIESKLADFVNALNKIKRDINDATRLFNERNEQFKRYYIEQQRDNDIKALNDANALLSDGINHFNDAANHFTNNQLNLGIEYNFLLDEKGKLANELNQFKENISAFRETIGAKSYTPDEKLREKFLEQITQKVQDFKVKINDFSEDVYGALEKYKSLIEKQRQMAETLKDMDSINNLNKDYQAILNSGKDFDDYVSNSVFLFGQRDTNVQDMQENIRDLITNFKQNIDNLRGSISDINRFSIPNYRSSFDNALKYAEDMHKNLKSFVEESHNQVNGIVSETIKTNTQLGKEIIKKQYDSAQFNTNDLSIRIKELIEKGDDLNIYITSNALNFGDKSDQINLHAVSLNELKIDISQSMSILKGMIKSSEQFKEQTHKYVFDSLFKNTLDKVNQLKWGLTNLDKESKDARTKFELETSEYNKQYEREQLIIKLNTKYSDISKDFGDLIDKLAWNKLKFQPNANQKILDQSENINDLLYTINEANNKMRKDIYDNPDMVDTLAKKTSQDLERVNSLLSNLDKYVDKSVSKFLEKNKKYREEYEARESLNELNAVNKLDESFKSANDNFSDLTKNVNIFDNQLGKKRSEIRAEFDMIANTNSLISESIDQIHKIISDKTRFSDSKYKTKFTSLLGSVEDLITKHKDDIFKTTRKIDEAVVEHDREQKEYMQQQQTARDLDTLYKLDLNINKMTNSFKEMLSVVNEKKTFMQNIRGSYEDGSFITKFNTESNQQITAIQDGMNIINLNRQLLNDMLSNPERFSDQFYTDKFKQLSEKINSDLSNSNKNILDTEHFSKIKAEEFESMVSKRELEQRESAQRIKDKAVFKLLDEQYEDMNENFDYATKNLQNNNLYLGEKAKVLSNDIYNMRIKLNEYKTKYDILKNINTSHLDSQYRAKFDDIIKSTSQTLNGLRDEIGKISDQVSKNIERVLQNYKQLNEVNNLDLRMSLVSEQILTTSNLFDQNKAFVSSKIQTDINGIKEAFDMAISKRNTLRDSLIESLESLNSQKISLLQLDQTQTFKFDKKMSEISADLSGVLNALDQTNKNINDQVQNFFETAKENERKQHVKESLITIEDAFNTAEQSLIDVIKSERNFNQITSDNKDVSVLLKTELDKLKFEYQNNINLYQKYDINSINNLKSKYTELLDKLKTEFRTTQNAYEKESQKTKEGIRMSYKNLTGKQLSTENPELLRNIKNAIETYQKGKINLLNLKDVYSSMANDINQYSRYMTTTRSAINGIRGFADLHKGDKSVLDFYKQAKTENHLTKQHYKDMIDNLSNLKDAIDNEDQELSKILFSLTNEQYTSEDLLGKIKIEKDVMGAYQINHQNSSEKLDKSLSEIMGLYSTMLKPKTPEQILTPEDIETDIKLRNMRFAYKIGHDQLQKLATKFNLPLLNDIALKVKNLTKLKDPNLLITTEQLQVLNDLKLKLYEQGSINPDNTHEPYKPSYACIEDMADCKIGTLLNIVGQTAMSAYSGAAKATTTTVTPVASMIWGIRNHFGRLERVLQVVQKTSTVVNKGKQALKLVGAANAILKTANVVSETGGSETGQEIITRAALSQQIPMLLNVGDILRDIKDSGVLKKISDVTTISQTDYLTVFTKTITDAPDYVSTINEYMNSDTSGWNMAKAPYIYGRFMTKMMSSGVFRSLSIGDEFAPGITNLF